MSKLLLLTILLLSIAFPKIVTCEVMPKFTIYVGGGLKDQRGEFREPYEDPLFKMAAYLAIQPEITIKSNRIWLAGNIMFSYKSEFLGADARNKGFRFMLGWDHVVRQRSKALLLIGLNIGYKWEKVEWLDENWCIFEGCSKWSNSAEDQIETLFFGPSIGIELSGKLKLQCFLNYHSEFSLERSYKQIQRIARAKAIKSDNGCGFEIKALYGFHLN